MIRIGTAGWSYEDWNAIVYPARPPRGFDRLSLLSTLFDTLEVNTTFYRIPPARMAAGWLRRIEHNPRFVFTAKLFRGFTHERTAGDAERREYAAALAPLDRAGRLGCVLAQFPMSFHATPENREYLTSTLRSLAPFALAVEFRHASWNAAETRDLLSAENAAFVNIDQPALSDNLGPTEFVTAPLAYFRFHGRNAPKWFGPDTSNEERYNYLYSADELGPWTGRIRRAEARTSRGVYAILNNHFRGQAVANALELQQALTGEVRHAPETLRAAYPHLAAVTRPEAVAQPPLFG